MFEGEDALKEVWSYGEKMSFQGIRFVYFMQNIAELIGAGYEILECFGDPIPFPKKFLESAGLPSNCKRISQHVLMAWAQSTFPRK